MIGIAIFVVSLLANGPKAFENAKCLLHTHHFCKSGVTVRPAVIIVVEPAAVEPAAAEPAAAEPAAAEPSAAEPSAAEPSAAEKQDGI